MPATNVETLTNPRDSLPNVYTNVTAREIDFVSRFSRNWDALREVLGIMRPVKKQNGTKLVSYTASVTLEDGDVDPGNVIPYSKATVVQSAMTDLTIQKYAKAVPIEDVINYGAEIAIQKTDDAFLTELQSNVMDDFYSTLTTVVSGTTITGTYETFQKAISMAIGKVRAKFKTMHKTITNVAVFVNVEDAYEYLGEAALTIQTAFGIDYLKNFLGANILILTTEVEAGKVVATPVENLVLYYIDPSDSDFAKLGLNYAVDGETNLIGFHANGNYSTAVGESFALQGMKLWPEYADGIAVMTIGT